MIDFTKWTDAELNAAYPFEDDPQWARLDEEITRRQSAGTWLTDGSTERVAAMIKRNTPASRRRLSRRARL